MEGKEKPGDDDIDEKVIKRDGLQGQSIFEASFLLLLLTLSKMLVCNATQPPVSLGSVIGCHDSGMNS